MKNKEMKDLIKRVEEAQIEANKVNIAIHSIDDVHRIVALSSRVNELLNHLATLNEEESK